MYVCKVRVMTYGLVKRKEVARTYKKLKGGKAAGVDGISVEFLLKGDDRVFD